MQQQQQRRWYGWLRMVLPGARLFRAPIWCPSGGGGTREAGNTVAESLVALYRVGRTRFSGGVGRLDRRRAWGVLNPRAREPKARTERFLRGKLNSDHGLFSSYEGRQGAVNGQDSCGFFRDAQGFGRLHAGSRASFISLAQGLHHHGPRYFNSLYRFLYDVWP